MTAWLEISMRVDGEAAEAAAELLFRYGYQGVVIEQDDIPPDQVDEGAVPTPHALTLRAYLPMDSQVEDVQARFEAALGYMRMMYPFPQPTYRVVQDEDWAEAWKAHYHPIRVGRRLFIRPQWIDVSVAPGDIEITLDPGMAFGTGTHPTTHMCLEALEDAVQPGTHLLDLGCGSGILAIAAVKLGAAHVLAVDIDAIAVETTAANARQNGTLDAMTVQQGSLDTVVTSARRFDLLVANILATVIIAMADQHLGEVVRPGGRAIFSGIIDTQADDVEAALRQTGLTPTGRRQMGDWVVIEAERAHTG